MSQPGWDDPDLDAGVLIRGALWLIQEVGVGETFTKSDIRSAFPEASQADRRIRDLRDYGWVIHTRREDASLTSEQSRLVTVGVAVWDKRERVASHPGKSITSRQREAVLARYDYLCSVCGISGGEAYPDDPLRTAVISVTQRTATRLDRTEEKFFVTECKKCRAGARSSRSEATEVIESAKGLSVDERERLLVWVAKGRRDLTRVEKVWSRYCKLPVELQAEVRKGLDDSFDQ